MLNAEKIRRIIEASEIYDQISLGRIRNKCGTFSETLKLDLYQQNVSSILVGNENHNFLITESIDEGIMMLDPTAHQFVNINGPSNWIYMPINKAIDHIVSLSDCDIKDYWLDVKVTKKGFDFNRNYGVDLTPNEKDLFIRAKRAIDGTAMNIKYNITPEDSKLTAQRVMDFLMIPTDMLPKEDLDYRFPNKDYIHLFQLNIYYSKLKENIIRICDVFKVIPGIYPTIKEIMQSEFCPEIFKGKNIETYPLNTN